MIENFAKLDLKKKMIASVLFFGVLIFLIAYYIIIPAIKDIEKIRDEIGFQRAELQQKYLRGQNLRNISEKLARAEDETGILSEVFIKENDGLKFVTTLENIADLNRIEQKINLAQSPSSQNEFYKIYPLQLFTQGDFADQMKYLIGLETLGYYINIKSLEISTGSKEELKEEEINLKKPVNILINSDTFWR